MIALAPPPPRMLQGRLGREMIGRLSSITFEMAEKGRQVQFGDRGNLRGINQLNSVNSE
jgi:hypothetical protein